MSLLTFLLLSVIALVVLVAWIIVRVGAEHERRMADVVEAMADRVIDDIQARRTVRPSPDPIPPGTP